MTFDPLTEAARHAHGDSYAVTMALIGVGHRIEELGRILDSVKENTSMPPYPHYTAIEVTDSGPPERHGYVPGELRGAGPDLKLGGPGDQSYRPCEAVKHDQVNCLAAGLPMEEWCMTCVASLQHCAGEVS